MSQKNQPTAGRLIRSIFSALEFQAVSRILELDLLGLIKGGLCADLQEADDICRRELLELLLNYLVCIKAAKKENGKYRPALLCDLTGMESIRDIGRAIDINLPASALQELISIIIRYNARFLVKYRPIFSRKSEKSFCRDMLSFSSGVGVFQDYIICMDDRKLEVNDIYKTLDETADEDKSVVLGGFSHSRRKTGPKYSLLLNIASMISGNEMKFEYLKAVQAYEEKKAVNTRMIRLSFGYSLLILNPKLIKGQ